MHEVIITNYCNPKMTTKTNKPAKSLGKFLFKIFISDLSRFQRGNWLHYQRCRWRKRPLIWAWLQKILACVLSSSRAPEPSGPRYNVPLVPPSRRPWPYAEQPKSLNLFLKSSKSNQGPNFNYYAKIYSI